MIAQTQQIRNIDHRCHRIKNKHMLVRRRIQNFLTKHIPTYPQRGRWNDENKKTLDRDVKHRRTVT